MSDELSWKWNVPIWWDPVPPWIFKELEEDVQNQVVRISLETQASIMQTQAASLRNISGILGGAKFGGGQEQV